MLTNIFCRQGSRLNLLPSPSSQGMAESCPLPLCQQEGAATLPCVFHHPGRSTHGIFPVGSPCQSLSCVFCHLKVGADSGVERSMNWIRSQQWGIIAVQLQTASFACVCPCSAAEVGIAPKWLLLLPMSGHWLHSSSGQS